MEKRKTKGITLIALIITIIVLLILAGVSIATLTGENGVLTRAREATEKSEQATEEEQRKLAMLEAATNTKNTTFEGITIPAGFAPTKIEGESTVEEGLVITDSEGNEFVWIPCKGEDKTKYENANELSKTEDWSNDKYKELEDSWENKPDPENEKAMNEAKASVGTYEGFYVARYEAGVPINASFYVPSNSSGNKTYAEEDDDAKTLAEKRKKLAEKRNVISEKKVDLKPVSKKGNQVWNFVDQTTAVTLSKNMYKDSSSVNSYLIDSNAWNYICKYIFEKSIDITNSSTYGNYYDNTKTNYEGIRGLFALHHSGIDAMEYEYGNIPANYAPRGKEENKNRLELATGICDDFKLFNIYDMAGNMWEWTAETVKEASSTIDYAVCRGGSFASNGSVDHVIICNGDNKVLDYSLLLGFRCVLYLK